MLLPIQRLEIKAAKYYRKIRNQISSYFRKAFFVDETKALNYPIFRGKIHLLLVYTAPIWSSVLLKLALNCKKLSALIATIISITSCLVNFTASALLHNIQWSQQNELFFRQLDYAGIFIMISGSCANIPFTLLKGKARLLVLVVQWLCAVFGVSMTFLGQYVQYSRVKRGFIYLVTGLINVAFSKTLYNVLIPYEKMLVITLGLCYGIGCLCYQTTKPNPWPNVFGFHEVFHGCCFFSAICTFLINHSILQRVSA